MRLISIREDDEVINVLFKSDLNDTNKIKVFYDQ